MLAVTWAFYLRRGVRDGARSGSDPCTAGTSTHTARTARSSARCGWRSTRPSTVTVAPRDFPTNRGGLCQKGWTSAAVLTAPDRITTPLVRGSDGELAPATWDDALALVAGRLVAVREASTAPTRSGCSAAAG